MFKTLFEKFAAFIFLLLLVGMIGFLTFIPVPEDSKQVILIIIGGLMTTAATSLPRMFGEVDGEKEELKARVRKLETEYAVLKENYDRVMQMLVERHVVDGAGIKIPHHYNIEHTKKGD